MRRLPGGFYYRVESGPGQRAGHKEDPAATRGYSFNLERLLDFEKSVSVTHGRVQIVEEGFRTSKGQSLGALEHIPLQEDAQPRPVGCDGDLVN
jgi:hypothetical protein